MSEKIGGDPAVQPTNRMCVAKMSQISVKEISSPLLNNSFQINLGKS